MAEKEKKVITVKMKGKDPEGIVERFLMQEFAQAWGYQQHLESQMVNHLRFYVTILLALTSAAIAIFKLEADSTFPTMGAVGILCLIFWFVGVMLRTAYVEIRVRKIRAIEDLNTIREYFADKFVIISEYTTFPDHRNKTPPFLRKGSAEWYTLVFMAFVNSVSLSISIYMTNNQWVYVDNLVDMLYLPVETNYIVWPLISLIFVIMFLWEYRWFTLHCYKYDLDREERFGERSKYTLLTLEDRALYEKMLIRLGRLFERNYLKAKRKKNRSEKE